MKLPYQKQVDHQHPHLPWTSRPIVRVRLSYGNREQALLALIDSGADVTLFHISVARVLGINTFEREGRAVGISGEPMPVFYQKLQLRIDGADETVEIEAGFIDSPGVGALLGQSGFFEHFRICFERRREVIEVHPVRAV